MDATRYFEEMHRAMAAQKTASQLVLTACYQDTAGSDAYLELRRSLLLCQTTPFPQVLQVLPKLVLISLIHSPVTPCTYIGASLC